MGWPEVEAFRTSLVPSSCHQHVPQQAGIFNTFSFPPQHRFLPCENKSKAVEQVKSAFNKVSCMVAGRDGLGQLPKGQMLSQPHPLLQGTVGTRQML